MSLILKILGWVLIAAAAVVLFYPLISSETVSNPLLNAIPAGVLVALGAQLLLQGKNASEKNEKRSSFFLESCVRAYDEAYNLLKDGNNDRGVWIATGRALIHAKELAKNVSDKSHIRVLELHKLKYRGIFHGILADKPAAFFFGAKDISISTEEAARLSTAREESFGRVFTSTVNELSETSLRAVWEAAQWPTDYQDPLKLEFTENEKAKLLVLFPGLHEFFEHKKSWISASGKLFPKNENTR